MMTALSKALSAASVFLVILLLVRAEGAQQAPPASPRPSQPWALLIGVEGYLKAPPLQSTVNDVRQLADTLVRYGGYSQDRILQISDEAAEFDRRPLKASLEKALPEFLQQPGPQDSIIVYFSGHGFRDKDGKLYLAPLDCDPARPTETCVSAEWFRRQLEACPAAFKLLVLDACHAGAEKDVEAAPVVAAKELGELFKVSAGVMTLASSTSEEKSQIWQFKRQSLFSYWLKEGLKGHADTGGDGAVNVDELYEYVHNHVRQTAEIRFRRPQTPVRIIGPRVPGVPNVVQLQPQKLKQVVADMAEQLAGLMEERQLASIGVLEFTNDTPSGELLGAEFGLLGKYCAKELEQGLIDRSAGKFSVVDQSRLQKALASQRFTLVSLESGSALTGLSKSVGGMPVLVKGSLSERRGRIVNLRGKLLETEGDKALGNVGGLAQLSESEWAMLGRSVIVRPEDRQPELTSGVVPPTSIEDRVVDRIDRRAQAAHPLLDPQVPFRVKMLIGGKERQPVYQGNDAFLPVRQGEVYELEVENRSGQIALMRLLVDGLNTLPEKETDAKGIATYVVGKRVNLEEARFWVLDANDPKARRTTGHPAWAFRGFVSELGTQGKYNEFLVVDADQSLAARRQFTDQIGLITVAFYLPKGGPRAVGTALGEGRTAEIRRYDNIKVGNLIAVLHLRYAEEGAVNSLVRNRR